MKQLVTISPLGSISSLDLRGKGLDLRKLGKVSIRRTTEIVWDYEYQRWYVRFVKLGRFTSSWITTGVAWLAKLPTDLLARHKTTVADDLILLFEEYDDAVAIEVEVIQSLRRQGIV